MLINRILIVGIGSIGKRHLRIARELFPDANIRVLRHQECLSIPEYADGCFSIIEQAVEFLPQIAVIANPAPFHLSVAQQLVEVGVHLLIEKPLSTSIVGVNKLIETCHNQGLVLMIGYNLRYLPSLQKFRNLLLNGAIGRVLSIRCEIGQYLPSWRPDIDYRQNVSARLELGGGVLLELSHELDYLRWIFGEVDWVKGTLSRQSTLEIDVEDTAHLILGFMHKDASFQLIGTVNLDFIRHDTTRNCTAIGENRTLRWNGLTGVVELYEAGAKEWREIFHHNHQRDDSYRTEWQNFIDCVKERKMPLVTGEDGLKVLQIIEAARISALTGGQVTIGSMTRK
ncbi:MAG: Gfo/Idh/MocA family oxidoreductase [Deltaproteobacteria bacterium]|jgi:predicted dehydrogenase|nr:Gfo/Idh/MocA family oxidoreductase [Deltaproteobacteria bacterium]